MREEILKFKEAIHNAKNDDEMDKIESQMQELCTKNPDAFAEAMAIFAKDTADRAEDLLIRQKLKDVIPVISMSYISKNYFKKSENWIYQRLNGNKINGKTATFTHDEIDTLKFALNDLSQRLGSISVSL